MNKLCKCGCGKIIPSNRVYYYMHSPNSKSVSQRWKGKTYEDVIGKKRAKSKKDRMSQHMKGKNEGKIAWNKGISNPYKGKKYGTYEERHGKEKALLKGKENSERQKNLPLEEKLKNYNKQIETKIRLGLMKSDNQLIQMIKNENEKGMEFTRSQLRVFLHVSESRIIKLGGTTKIAEYAGIEFKIVSNGFGTDEKQILDHIEKEKETLLERQYYVCGKRIDGYDPINNIAYEVDEPHHKNQLEEDLEREIFIKEKIGCTFVRINEREYLNRIRNKVLGDFDL